jgi:MSHA biogenesis protein MshL
VLLKVIRPLFLVSIVFLHLLMLTACESVRPNPRLFDASKEHIQVKPTNNSEPAVPIPSVSSKAPYIPKPRSANYNDLYSISVMQVPIKDVLFKLARDANLDIDVMDNTDGLVTLNVLDKTLSVIIERLNEQTGLRITLKDNHLIVQADKAYWVNYPIDYVNLERYSQSSLLLANAVGRSAQTASTVSLGASSQAQQAVSLQSGSSFAVLNRSQHELWKTLGTGVMRTLRAMYPVLAPPIADGMTETTVAASGGVSNAGDSSTASSLSGLEGLANSGGTLPGPEQPLITAPFPIFSPYPEKSPVSNYVTLAREAGFIAVYAPEKGHKEVQKYINKMMEGSRKQVMIETTVVEVELNDESQSGINWSALASDGSFSLSQVFNGTSTASTTAGLVSITGSSISKDWSLGSTLKLLERFGNSRVLSSPKMVGINNQQTLLKVVKNLVYFSVQAQVIAGMTGQAATRAYTTTPITVPVGLVMNILPSISESNEITLVVRPTISTLSGYAPDPNPDLVDPAGKRIDNLVPIVQEREMESVLKLNDGQVAILGGLIQDTVEGEDTGVPGMMSESITGYLFGQKNRAKHKSELIIFLKPVLVTHPDIENGSFSDKKNLLPVLDKQPFYGSK